MDVILKITNNEKLEELVPIDRVVTANNGFFSLLDTEFILTEDMIERILCQ